LIMELLPLWIMNRGQLLHDQRKMGEVIGWWDGNRWTDHVT
jgi:Protein of unknown function (DUF2510)